ncbi:uncharacterized protein N7479_008572 [Penicillium vulpinum]|uniref:Uncharacterized protein n=1 Tax=Penicillium vulpinum TaxID=29845 RepID=A0A1V6RDK2_9EURO|nr:uncharacterized protein N7479_008572 [Penicillium vulpinum]KAJ5950159.1 hypothetical protein N7479_008572 [Penicillium vulpinum]OQD99377.1 hypothetical protein PENVUL_c064G06253 [Penicillium vulpinum]
MRFTAALLFITTARGAQHHHQRDITDNGINLGAISSALENMMGNQTASANFGNISPAPKSLVPEILSVVPVSVIWELINPAERSSLASQFKAGTTPAWYNALPSDVKSYMSVVKSQISAGALTATESETKPTAANTGAATIATATEDNSGGVASSTSKGAAAKPTELTVSALGVLGVLGLALAL